jgi:ABC-type branched-subunit amino acid transport system substrate-binding protein
MLATLEHTNLPKVIDYFSQGGRHYLIMEYLKGDDLGRILANRGKPLEEGQVAAWAAQIATVLYYLHRQKEPIIFRDIKPSNIMICSGQVKLIDFGIARHFNPLKSGDTLRLGSPGYSPPEQYNGQTDPRSDIYSLGVTMHQLLTGQDPTRTQTPFSLPPIKAFNPAISSQMVSIVEKAIQLDPAKRYQTAIELKKDLRELYKGDEAPLAPPAGKTREVPVPGSLTLPTPGPVPPSAVKPAAQSTSQARKTREVPGDGVGIKEGKEQKAKSPGSPWGGVRALIGLVVLAGLVFLGGSLPIVKGWLAPPLPSPTLTPTPVDLPPLEKGKLLLSQGRYPEALEQLRVAQAKDPASPQVLVALNNALALAGGGETITVPVAASKIQPERSPGFLLGLCLAQVQINLEGGIRGKKVVLDLFILTGGTDSSLPAGALGGKPPALLTDAGGSALERLILAAAGQKIMLFAAGEAPAGVSIPGVVFWGLSPQAQAGALAELARREGRSRIFLVREGQGGGGQEDAFKKAMEERGVKVAGEAILGGDNVDFGKALEGIRGTRPDAVAFMGTGARAALLAGSLQKAGLEKPLLLAPGAVTGDFTRLAGKGRENVTGILPFHPAGGDYPGSYFAASYGALFGPSVPGMDAARGYDLLNLLSYAGRKASPEADRISRFFSSPGGDAAFTGVAGTLGAPGAGGARWWGIVKISGGEWKDAGGFEFQ